ncbi:MAG TPA: hypothetical protein VEO54_12615 [Thermoanaerobaculia bacterium]|nr:hypothetical protein [Thermoanaerobaculia bacterium]
MTTTRPILGAEVTPSRPQPQPTSAPAEQPLAKGLPPWDLMPSDLLLVRRRPVKK